MADDFSELARLLASSPVQSIEGGVERENPLGWWGPKTATDDKPWHIPESKIGEMPYRYQGVALHGLLAAIAARMGQPVAMWGNAAYGLGSHLAGLHDPVARPEPQMPMPVYPMRNKLAGDK